jgi:propanediol dehydratase large subunit
MKLSLALSMLAAAGLATAAEQALMERLMSIKVSQRESFRAQGVFGANKYGRTNTYSKCANGKSGEYACENVDMHGFLSHEEMGSVTREGNDVWGVPRPTLAVILRNLY